MNGVAAVAVTIAIVGLAYGSPRVSRYVAKKLELGAFAPGALAMALSVAMFLIATALVGRAAKSFDAGLVAAAVAGVVAAVASRRLQVERGERAGIGFWVALVSVGALYTYLATRYQIHDEHPIFGHKSMLEELRHGYYPPYYPPIPNVEARYHYGFDVLAGALARAYGLSSDNAIDVVTVAMALFMSWSAAAVAADNGARRSVPFAAIAIHLGAGLAAFILAGVPGRHPRCLIQYHHPTCGSELFPTQLLNIFQHPVSLGVPLFLAVVLIAPRLVSSSKSPWLAALVMLPIQCALSLGQIVFYGLGAMSLIAALPVWLFRRPRTRELLIDIARPLLVLGAAHLGGMLLGGLLTSTDAVEPGLLVRRTILGFPENHSFLKILHHHVANLGLGFVLLPALIALMFINREKKPAAVHLFAFAAGGILASHLFTYLRSWDIVKFPSAASFALVMLYILLADGERSFPWTWARRTGRILILGTGTLAAIFLAVPLRGDLRPYDLGSFGPDPQVKRAIDWFWANGYEKDQLIWAQENIAPQLAVFGGLSIIGEDTDLFYQGISSKILTEQRRASSTIKASMDRNALQKYKVRWILLSDEEIPNLGVRGREVLEDPKGPLELAATFDDPGEPKRRRRIWKVKP